MLGHPFVSVAACRVSGSSISATLEVAFARSPGSLELIHSV
jgi:hypothetical protein